VPTAGAAGLTGWALARYVVATADLTLAATADLVATATRLGGREVQLAPLLLPDPTPPRRTPAEVRDELGFDAGGAAAAQPGRLHTRRPTRRADRGRGPMARASTNAPGRDRGRRSGVPRPGRSDRRGRAP
jgi:hypothetical protein